MLRTRILALTVLAPRTPYNAAVYPKTLALADVYHLLSRPSARPTSKHRHAATQMQPKSPKLVTSPTRTYITLGKAHSYQLARTKHNAVTLRQEVKQRHVCSACQPSVRAVDPLPKNPSGPDRAGPKEPGSGKRELDAKVRHQVIATEIGRISSSARMLGSIGCLCSDILDKNQHCLSQTRRQLLVCGNLFASCSVFTRSRLAHVALLNPLTCWITASKIKVSSDPTYRKDGEMIALRTIRSVLQDCRERACGRGAHA